MDVALIDKFDEALTTYDKVQEECAKRIADAKFDAIQAQASVVKTLPDKLTVVRALSGNHYVAEKGAIRKVEEFIVSADTADPVEP